MLDLSTLDQPGPLGPEAALAAAQPEPATTRALTEAAAARRDAAWGRRLTYSPKVFLPLTNLCRNFCDYCSFRRSPKDAGAHTMPPDEVRRQLDAAAAVGCVEALFCLGDTPEGVFPSYRGQLEAWGFRSTVDYLREAGEWALERGLLPHTNAGILDATAMTTLREVNVSLGLMLESASERLCGKGQPHHRAPDKRPARRLAMHDEAGRLRIPFTSGVLIGIGETPRERVEALLAIRQSHERHGHVQEVIVQNFRAHEATPMAGRGEPASDEVAHTVALARLILPDEVSVQAPPNLNPADTARLIRAGVNDFGGISPLTPDFINPGYPWPHVDRLAEQCAAEGFELAPRLPVYERYLRAPGWLDARLEAPVAAVAGRLAAHAVREAS